MDNTIYMIERHLSLELDQVKKTVKRLKKMKLGDAADVRIEKSRITNIIV